MSIREFERSFSTKDLDITLRCTTIYDNLKRISGVSKIGKGSYYRGNVTSEGTMESEKSINALPAQMDVVVNEFFSDMFNYINKKEYVITTSKFKPSKKGYKSEFIAAIIKKNDESKYENYPQYLLSIGMVMAATRLPKASGKLCQYVMNSFAVVNLGTKEKPQISIRYEYPLEYPTIFKGRVKHIGEVGRIGSTLYPSEYYTPTVVRTTPKTKLVILNDPEASAYPLIKINSDLDQFLMEDISESIKSIHIEIDIESFQLRNYNKWLESPGHIIETQTFRNNRYILDY
jgi:hypothetical protein